MPTGEAAATAEGQDPRGRSKSSSPRHIPVIAVVTEDEETQVRTGVCAVGAEPGSPDSKGGNEDLGGDAGSLRRAGSRRRADPLGAELPGGAGCRHQPVWGRLSRHPGGASVPLN